jgi:hypothetical protein
MKKSIVASLSMAALVLVKASSAFASASVTTLASTNMTADTAGTGGTGAYTTLTGPALVFGESPDTTGASGLFYPRSDSFTCHQHSGAAGPAHQQKL